MATVGSIRVVKQFTYRGSLRNFSNRYHFATGVPADSTHWTTFSDAIVTAEKAIYEALASGGAKIVETFGYAAGSEVPVFSKTYATDGTGTFAGFTVPPGDVAALVRYSTAARSSKNHPLYLFNYYHTFSSNGGAGNQDLVLAAQKTALQTYAADWVSGFSDGSEVYVRCGPNGQTALGSVVNSDLTHRDLPR